MATPDPIEEYNRRMSGRQLIQSGGPAPSAGLTGSLTVRKLTVATPMPPELLGGGGDLVSGALVSGYITSAPLASGSVVSGWSRRVLCGRCKGNIADGGQVMVSHGVNAVSFGAAKFFCFHCAGWLPDEQRFATREDWITQTVPLQSGTPAEIVADWLRDHCRDVEADHMLGVAQGVY